MNNTFNQPSILETFILKPISVSGGTGASLTGGTFSALTLTLTSSDNNSVVVTGFTDFYTTGVTFNTATTIATFTRNDNTTYQLDLSSLKDDDTYFSAITVGVISATTYQNLPIDIRVTGGTFSGGSIIFVNNTGGTFNVTGISSTDFYTTASTYNAFTGVESFTRNDNVTYTAGTWSYLSAITLDNNVITTIKNGTIATTSIINAATGGTYTAGTITLQGSGTLSTITGLGSLSSTTIYNSDDSLTGNRIVGLGSNTLAFSSATNPNNLVLSGGNVFIGSATGNSTDRLQITGSTLIISDTGIIQRSISNGVPLRGLSLQTTLGAEVAYFKFSPSNGEVRMGGGGSYFPTFYSNAVEAMRIPTSGNILIGTTTDDGLSKVQISGAVRVTINNLSATTISGLTLINPSSAANGVQQASPAIVFEGQGWKTTATAASQSVKFQTFVDTVQGTTAPSGILTFQNSICGSTFGDIFQINSTGTVVVGPRVGKIPTPVVSPILQLNRSDGATSILFQPTTNDSLYNLQRTGSHIFQILSVETMRIGNHVLIGTTTDDGVNKLQVSGGVSSILNSLGTTSISGLSLINTTLATSATSQYSPALYFEGQGWKTSSTASSQTVAFRQYLVPLSGGSNPQFSILEDYNIAATGSTLFSKRYYDGTTQSFGVAPGVSASGQFAGFHIYSYNFNAALGGIIGNPQSGEIRVGGFNNGGYFLTLYSNNFEAARIAATTRNLLLNTTIDDGVNKLQVSGSIISTINNIGTTPLSGLSLVNNTAATTAASQYSPSILFRGSGWKTNATATAQTINVTNFLAPQQSTASAATALFWNYNVGGGPDTNWFYISQVGVVVNPPCMSIVTPLANGMELWAIAGPINFRTSGGNTLSMAANTITAQQPNLVLNGGANTNFTIGSANSDATNFLNILSGSTTKGQINLGKSIPKTTVLAGDFYFDTGNTFNFMGGLSVSADTAPLRLQGLTASTTDLNILSIDNNGNLHSYSINSLTGTSTSATTIYSSDGILAGNRFVDLSSSTLTFSSSTATGGTLTLSGTSVYISRDNIATTTSPGLQLVNNTLATSATTVQNSPSLFLTGSAWKTNATASAQTMTYQWYVAPTSAAATITGSLILSKSINGAAYSNIIVAQENAFTLTIGSTGINTSGIGLGGLVATSSNIVHQPTAQITTTLGINGAGIRFNHNSSTLSAGTQYGISQEGTFAPTTGSTTYAGAIIMHTINQSTGATGVTRGIYISPTLSAYTDYRGLEINLGSASATTRTGISLINSSAATSANTSQYSPTLYFEGQGWKTTATAASQSIGLSQYTTPVSAAANPTLSHNFDALLAGSATTILQLLYDFSASHVVTLNSPIGAATTFNISNVGGPHISMAGNRTIFPNTFVRVNQKMNVGSTADPTGLLTLAAGTSATSQMNWLAQVAKATPVSGDVYFDTASTWNWAGGLNVTKNSISTGTTSGYSMINTAVATSGAQENSPSVLFRGSGWRTAATASAQTLDVQMYLKPSITVAQQTWPSLVHESNVNGTGFTNWFTVSQNSPNGNLNHGGWHLNIPSAAGGQIIAGGTFLIVTNSGIHINCGSSNVTSFPNTVVSVTQSGFVIGSGSTHATAASSIYSTTKGFLPPVMTSTQRLAITATTPAEGLIVYDTTLHGISYYNGSQWNTLTSSATTIYNSDDTLQANRLVNMSSNTLTFSSSTSPNNLVLSGGSVGIGTNTPNAYALLDIVSTTKGVLFPRMTLAQRNVITGTTGLIVYQTDGSEGLYIYKSFGWVQII